MNDPAIVRHMRSIIKEQFSEIERKQAAYFLIENANRMARVTEKPTLEAFSSIEDGEHVARVLAGLATEAYGLGYSEAVTVLFPGFDDLDGQHGADRRGSNGSSNC
jgi:uncharacterized phage protein gp47/JayE